MTISWCAGYNTAGYLPESEPFETSSFTEAMGSLLEEFRQLDYDICAQSQWASIVAEMKQVRRMSPGECQWVFDPDPSEPHCLLLEFWVQRVEA